MIKYSKFFLFFVATRLPVLFHREKYYKNSYSVGAIIIIATERPIDLGCCS